MRSSLACVAVLALAVPSVGWGGQVVLTPSSVIGGTADYYGGVYNANPASDGFAAGHVADQQTAAIVTEGPTNFDYWLTSTTSGYIVIDLGSSIPISEIDLYNTHNQQYNDRGTGTYDIMASNSISTVSATLGSDLVSPTKITIDTPAASPAGTTLAPSHSALTPTASDPIAPQVAPLDPALAATSFRYIRFDALAPVPGGASVGLNEIKVFTATPEPGSLALLGIGALGLLARRRVASR